MHKIRSLIAAMFAMVLTATMPLPAAAASGQGQPCRGFTSRHVEVCTAYIANASLAARLPYYQFGGSSNPARAVAASNRLASRYSGAALAEITAQVSGWAGQKRHVSLPVIHVTSVDVQQDATATLTTTESWRVTDANGAVLYSERQQPHVIFMQRVPGIILHKWIVTDIR